MGYVESVTARILDYAQDPFYWLIFLVFCVVMVFSHYQEKNRRSIKEQLKDEENIIFLSRVWVTHLAKTIGTSRAWFQVDLIFTPDSIFVFGGGGKASLHTQFYSRLNPQPKKLIMGEKNFLPIDEIKIEGNNLIIYYVSPHWHGAKCTLILKKVMQKKEAESIQLTLREGFGI